LALLVLLHLVLMPCGRRPPGRTSCASRLGARLVPAQSMAWPQPAVLAELSAQNLSAGATSPRIVPWDSEPVSQEPWSSAPGQLNTALWIPVGRTPACHGSALQGESHQVPGQQLQ